MKPNICCRTKSIHPLFSLFITSDDLGEGLEEGLDHLLAGGLGVRELHGDEPVVVVAPLEKDLVGADIVFVRPATVVTSSRGRRRRPEPGSGGGAGEERARKRRDEGGGEEEGTGGGCSDGDGRAEEEGRGGGGGGGGEGSPEAQREGHGVLGFSWGRRVLGIGRAHV